LYTEPNRLFFLKETEKNLAPALVIDMDHGLIKKTIATFGFCFPMKQILETKIKMVQVEFLFVDVCVGKLLLQGDERRNRQQEGVLDSRGSFGSDLRTCFFL
jgi:hypothetical protein